MRDCGLEAAAPHVKLGVKDRLNELDRLVLLNELDSGNPAFVVSITDDKPGSVIDRLRRFALSVCPNVSTSTKAGCAGIGVAATGSKTGSKALSRGLAFEGLDLSFAGG